MCYGSVRALAEDLEIAAVRVGMLGSAAVADAVASALSTLELRNIVVDPVLRSSSGADLLDQPGLQVLRDKFLPLADVITPNVDEAAALAGIEAPPVCAPWEELLPWLRATSGKLRGLGSRAVVITGGHLTEANDYLSYVENGTVREAIFPGGAYSVRLNPRDGMRLRHLDCLPVGARAGLPQAVRAAKQYVRRAIEAAYPLGKGIGPLNHMV